MQNSSSKIIILLLLSFVIYPAKAGNIDLELQINIDISEGVEFQQTGEFSITLINHGPDAAGSDATIGFPVSVQTSPIKLNVSGFVDVSFSKDTTVTQECSFVTVVASPPPGGSASYGYKFGFPIIPANSSLTCYGLYHVGFEFGAKAIKWTARSFTDIEANLDNNSVELVFGIPPNVIPTTNIYFLMLLIALIILIQYRFSRRFL